MLMEVCRGKVTLGSHLADWCAQFMSDLLCLHVGFSVGCLNLLPGCRHFRQMHNECSPLGLNIQDLNAGLACITGGAMGSLHDMYILKNK